MATENVTNTFVLEDRGNSLCSDLGSLTLRQITITPPAEVHIDVYICTSGYCIPWLSVTMYLDVCEGVRFTLDFCDYACICIE